MNVQEQIKEYLAVQPETKRADLIALHRRILHVLPKCKLWFLDGKDAKGKTVTNPNIGYGLQTINMQMERPKIFTRLASVQTPVAFQFISLA